MPSAAGLKKNTYDAMRKKKPDTSNMSKRWGNDASKSSEKWSPTDTDDLGRGCFCLAKKKQTDVQFISLKYNRLQRTKTNPFKFICTKWAVSAYLIRGKVKHAASFV